MESNNLLPDFQHGFRKFHNTTDGVSKMIDFIKTEWKKKHVVSILTLDMSGAYDNVHIDLLLHKMSKLTVPEYLLKWIRSFL